MLFLLLLGFHNVPLFTLQDECAMVRRKSIVSAFCSTTWRTHVLSLCADGRERIVS